MEKLCLSRARNKACQGSRAHGGKFLKFPAGLPKLVWLFGFPFRTRLASNDMQTFCKPMPCTIFRHFPKQTIKCPNFSRTTQLGFSDYSYTQSEMFPISIILRTSVTFFICILPTVCTWMNYSMVWMTNLLIDTLHL